VTISIINACILVEGVFEGKKEQSLGNQTFISVCLRGSLKSASQGDRKSGSGSQMWRAKSPYICPSCFLPGVMCMQTPLFDLLYKAGKQRSPEGALLAHL